MCQKSVVTHASLNLHYKYTLITINYTIFDIDIRILIRNNGVSVAYNKKYHPHTSYPCREVINQERQK